MPDNPKGKWKELNVASGQSMPMVKKEEESKEFVEID
jgi:hypothetical protein